MRSARLLALLAAVAAIVGFAVAQTGGSVTAAHVAALRDIIFRKIKAVPSVDAFGNPYFPLIAGCVRLAFHACVGDQCGGCLNLQLEANNGLNLTVQALEDVRQTALADSRLAGLPASALTRADLWALSAAVAFELAAFKPDVDLTGVPNVAVVFGRQDCATAPYTTLAPTFPSRVWSIDSVLAYFAGFGFNAREAVALIGAHSLGVVRDIGTPAIKAQWDHTPGVASNEFYQFLLRNTSQWVQAGLRYTQVPYPIYSFSRNGNTGTDIMLNSDVAIVSNLTIVDPVTGQAGCTFTQCQQSSTIGVVRQYAQNGTLWLIDFINVLNKLIVRGYSSGALYAPV